MYFTTKVMIVNEIAAAATTAAAAAKIVQHHTVFSRCKRAYIFVCIGVASRKTYYG